MTGPRQGVATVRASRFVSTVALSMCVAAMTGGCGQGTGQNDAGESRSVPRSARAQDDLLKSAESALVRRCLTERKVSLPPTPRESANGSGSGSAQNQGAARQRQFPYGIDDPAWAAEYGFGSAAGTGEPDRGDGARDTSRTQRTQRTRQTQQQQLADALFGTGRRELSTRTATGQVVKANSDGCLAETQRVLYGDQARWFRSEVAVNNLEAGAHQRVTRDPAYRAVLARWSRCVAPVQKAEDPGELRSAWQRRARDLEPRQATDLQRRYAVAEARCVRSTGLASTGARLEKGHAADVRAEYADLIADHRQMRERGLRYAVRHGI
ncbi:hypothetical protein FE633_21970 [Streptomyces montanus]|uniref:Lipoprotein n=1 Tax=Streptomyces montanus TaxID=2580423 RepID=A0A5R9FUN5_9ACTN|nr:hypothetical protein [Streptomyces montanus]TLS44214.1 hypothetical protein FE633_21970 [Streptomyces montanus]